MDRSIAKRGKKIVRRPRRAYTLTELLLVVALLVLLAAIAWPTLDGLLATFRMREAADMVRACWADARAHAMNEGQAYRFSVLPGKGNFRVAPDSPDYWSGNDPTPSDPNNPPLFHDDVLPRGVRFSTPDTYQSADMGGDSSQPAGSVDPGSWSTIVTFLPDGTANQDVEIVFTGAGARPLDVKLRGLTGAVSVQPLNGP
jgi:prepilin-type N-terminal cleavage/methylation domain-containing protein